MNVCGGHERSIATRRPAQGAASKHRVGAGPRLSGLRLPGGNRLPGDPARAGRKCHPRRLRRHASRAGQRAQKRSAILRAGARCRRRYRANRLAAGGRPHRPQQSHRRVVFFAAGFETTTAPVAAMLAEGVPDNLSVLLAGRDLARGGDAAAMARPDSTRWSPPDTSQP